MKTNFRRIRFYLIFIPLIVSSNFVQGQVFNLVTDTVDLFPEIPKTVNLIANDIYPAGDSLQVICNPRNNIFIDTINGFGIFTLVDNPWGTAWGGIPACMGHYAIRDFTLDTLVGGTIFFRIWDYSYDSLYINNINARFNACGNHFWGAGQPYARFEVPKFSGKSTIFSNTLWIGGLDNDSTLYLAAEKYRQGPTTGYPWSCADFWAGPVMNSSQYSIYRDNDWNYIWNLRKSDIDYHKAHWSDQGYNPIHDIYTWPGNGNVSLGQAAQLSPFFDRNNNGIYNPWDGDYPLIKGDQSLFFIFNDDRNFHSESHGKNLRVEVHGMAYAFDMPEDSAFNNTIFLNYKIYNRSNRTYFNTYIGTFTDLDIGFMEDDFIGCDVERSSYYGYNGTPVDGNGQPGSYGANPPAQAVTLLGGPFLDPDGIDNPRFDGSGHQLCNESVNGLNFGDSIVDNERYGMMKFISFFPPNWFPYPENQTGDYYKHLEGRWADSTQLIYGGNGNTGTGGYGPACNFMFPGESDTLNWGIGCQLPNGPVNWTERTANNNPKDKRGLASMGPFTFHPGQMEEVDLAFIFARDYAGQDTLFPSVGKLRQMIDIIRNSFITNKLPNGNSFNGLDDLRDQTSFFVNFYPNPTSSFVNIDFDKSLHESAMVYLLDYKGILLKSFDLRPGTTHYNINTSDLPNGMYLIQVIVKDQSVTKKVAIIR